MVKKIGVILLFILAGSLGFYCAIKNTQSESTPITDMRTYHYPSSFVSGLKNDPKAGEKIYREYCAACHAPQPMIDINAPAKGNKALWQALNQSLGEEGLWQYTLMGHNAMPARGGCFECSDEQLRQAVRYLEEAQGMPLPESNTP